MSGCFTFSSGNSSDSYTWKRSTCSSASAERGVEVEVGILGGQELLELGDAGPFDRLAGDRALEDVVGLVRGVDGQLEREAVDEVDVREDPLLAVLADLLALDRVIEAVLVEQVRDRLGRVGEDVQVDVGAFADVAGEDAADEPRAERRQAAHHGEGGQPHREQVVGPRCRLRTGGRSAWIWSRISTLLGRSAGLTQPLQICCAAFILAV